MFSDLKVRFFILFLLIWAIIFYALSLTWVSITHPSKCEELAQESHQRLRKFLQIGAIIGIILTGIGLLLPLLELLFNKTLPSPLTSTSTLI